MVRLRQGLRFGGEDLPRFESLSLEEDELFLDDEWWWLLLFLLDDELDLLELDFDEDDSTIGASAQ